jgi:RNA polymerase-binding transcription factor DksA
MNEYGEVPDNLIDILEDLDERLGKITTKVGHADELLSKKFSEQAIEKNVEIQGPQEKTATDEMRNPRQKIARMDNRGYGNCVVCGEGIQKNRLKALPFSDKCVKCAQKES